MSFVIRAEQHLRRHRSSVDAILFSAADGAIPAWLQGSTEHLRVQFEGIRSTLHFQQQLDNFSTQADKPFELFILGEGKFGKSTLLNTLLGDSLSKVHFLPETRSFLRFLVSSSPTADAVVFARLRGGMHDWLRSHIGEGAQCELFELSRHVVPTHVAEFALAEEAARCRRAGTEPYEPAIYEVERTVSATRAAPLGQLRIVDTQGLNQIFPEELQRMVEACDARTSEARLEQWLRATARGKHLEWEYRRCDTALWVLHALKANSAISRAALRYFGRYGKATMLVVTNIDLVPIDDRDRVLETIA